MANYVGLRAVALFAAVASSTVGFPLGDAITVGYEANVSPDLPKRIAQKVFGTYNEVTDIIYFQDPTKVPLCAPCSWTESGFVLVSLGQQDRAGVISGYNEDTDVSRLTGAITFDPSEILKIDASCVEQAMLRRIQDGNLDRAVETIVVDCIR